MKVNIILVLFSLISDTFHCTELRTDSGTPEIGTSPVMTPVWAEWPNIRFGSATHINQSDLISRGERERER